MTREQIEKLAYNTYPEEKVCNNCGATFGLHHSETDQCPKNGCESDWDKKQEWQNTYYSILDNAGKRQAYINGYEDAIEKMKQDMFDFISWTWRPLGGIDNMTALFEEFKSNKINKP